MDDSSKDLIETSSDILETGVDYFIDNEIIKDIPILGIAVKTCFTVKSISDKIFLKKIQRFIFHVDQINEEEKVDMSSKIAFDDATRSKVGETLILLLDRINDLEKPFFLAKCFSAYINKKISYDDFVRLGNAIDLSYVPDLTNFISDPKNEQTMESLLRSGLTSISRHTTGVGIEGFTSVSIGLEITEPGKIFISIFK